MHPESPLISVIVPVLHEAASINEVVAHVKALPYSGPREILVVDGAPGADTLACLAHADVCGLAAPRGRAAQMNAGAAMARGEVLCFLHADTRLPEQGLPRMVEALGDPAVVAGAFRLGFDRSGLLYGFAARMGNLRNRLTRTPYGDQALFFRAAAFRELGGFADLPIMEDVEIMRRIRKLRRGRIAFVGEAVRTSTRRYGREGMLRAALRNQTLRVLYALGVPAGRLARFYRPHGGHA